MTSTKPVTQCDIDGLADDLAQTRDELEEALRLCCHDADAIDLVESAAFGAIAHATDGIHLLRLLLAERDRLAADTQTEAREQ